MPNEPCIRWRPDPLREGIIWGRVLQCGLSSKFVDHLLPLLLAKHLRSVFFFLIRIRVTRFLWSKYGRFLATCHHQLKLRKNSLDSILNMNTRVVKT